MRELVIFSEDQSANPLCEHLFKVLLPEMKCTIMPLIGWRRLQQKFPALMNQWGNKNANFIILHDNHDNGKSKDCLELKQHLLGLIPPFHRSRTKVRLICMELETWFLADLSALLAAGLINEGSFHQLSKTLAENDIDLLQTPKELLKKHVKLFREIACATQIARFLNLENKKSASFALFIKTLKEMNLPLTL